MPHKRRHHYVPEFQLAFFTSDGTKNGDLYVFDLDRKTVRKSTPHNEAHKANLYTPDAAAVASAADPVAARTQFEDFFSGVESDVAPVIKGVVANGKLPFDLKERAWILYFVAMNIFRTPEFLQQAEASARRVVQQLALNTLQSEELWKRHQARKAAEGRPMCDADRARLIGLFQKYPDAVTMNKGSLLELIPRAIDLAVPLLEKRRWRVEALPPEGGDLVLPNCPVTLWQRSEVVPLDLRGLLAENTLMLLPLSPRTLLVSSFGRNTALKPSAAARPGAAAPANTAAYNSLEQRGRIAHKSACVFARRPDFPMVAADGKMATLRALYPEFKGCD